MLTCEVNNEVVALGRTHLQCSHWGLHLGEETLLVTHHVEGQQGGSVDGAERVDARLVAPVTKTQGGEGWRGLGSRITRTPQAAILLSRCWMQCDTSAACDVDSPCKPQLQSTRVTSVQDTKAVSIGVHGLQQTSKRGNSTATPHFLTS
jgi:hypothetical protein